MAGAASRTTRGPPSRSKRAAFFSETTPDWPRLTAGFTELGPKSRLPPRTAKASPREIRPSAAQWSRSESLTSRPRLEEAHRDAALTRVNWSGVCPRPEPVRLNHGRGRGHDRLRHLHCSRGDGPPCRKRWLAFGGLGRSRRADHCGCSLLRRTLRHDASRRWHVYLPAGGVFSTVGIPLRLDVIL